MSKICPRYAQDTPQIPQRYAQDMPKIHPRYIQDVPKIHPRCAQDMPKIGKRYAPNIPKTIKIPPSIMLQYLPIPKARFADLDIPNKGIGHFPDQNGDIYAEKWGSPVGRYPPMLTPPLSKIHQFAIQHLKLP